MARKRHGSEPPTKTGGVDVPEAQPEEPFAVGYKRPPRHSRFKPGQSGNPKGRPKGARSPRVLWNEMIEGTVVVNDGKRRRRVTKRELIYSTLLASAARGDAKAREQVLRQDERMLASAEPVDAAAPAQDMEAADRAALERFVELRPKLAKAPQGGQ
jgi:hypothetical protein